MNVELLYEGDFFLGKRHGKGKEISKIEDYEGDFKNDKRDGKGLLKFTTINNLYKGDFSEGLMTGTCIFEWVNGDNYEGCVINGIFHGKGKYFWKNGNEYEGNYEKGIRNGIGVFKWKEGKVYKGEFKNNLPHGKGIIIQNGIENPIMFKKGRVISNFNNKNNRENSTISK